MRYRLIDTTVLAREDAIGRKSFPAAANAGKFNSLPTAVRTLRNAVPRSRFVLIDSHTGDEITA